MITDTERISAEEAMEGESSGPVPFLITSVRLRRLHAELVSPPEREDGEAEAVGSVELSLQTGEDDTEEGFDVGLFFSAEQFPVGDEAFTMSVLIEARFVWDSELGRVDEETVERFKSQDALWVLFPYLRETVHNMTRRMELNLPPLPVLNPSRERPLDDPDSS